MDQAAHHYEQLLLQKRIEETLQKALQEPLTTDDAQLLACACGVTLPKPDTQRTRT
jgi:hypothetical protein